MRVLTLLLVSFVISAAGCTSVKSTLINRTETGDLTGNSNGNPKSKFATRPFNGVPITMRVPTHVEIVILETLLLKTDRPGHLERVHTSKRNFVVQTKVIETEKVFTVDIKRPAAGTLDYKMDFGEGKNSQYFKQVTSEIEDKTIADITAALGDITKAIATSAQPTDADGVPPNDIHIIPELRMVAWRRFDIDSVDLEAQIAAFVAQHLNNCNTCHTYQAWNFSADPQHDEFVPYNEQQLPRHEEELPSPTPCAIDAFYTLPQPN